MAKRNNMLFVYGAAAVFLVYYLFSRREMFTEWPGAGVRATPPLYAVAKEKFVSKKCPDGTRSDGPCLMEFPGF